MVSAPPAASLRPLPTHAQSRSSSDEDAPSPQAATSVRGAGKRRGLAQPYVTLPRRRLRGSPCCQRADAVGPCYSCGVSGGGQGSRPVHSCLALGKSPSRDPGHCVLSPRKETCEMEKESVRRHRRKSQEQRCLHLSLCAAAAWGPDVFRHWKASDCRRLDRSHPLESARTRVETKASLILHTEDPGVPYCLPWPSP